MNNLRRWGLAEPVAVLLEAGGPLSILVSQTIYLGQPFFNGLNGSNQLQAIQQILENDDEKSSFIDYLHLEGEA